MLGMGQTIQENRSTEDLKSSFRVTISTQLLMQRSPEIQSNTSGFSNQEELFYQNPVFGISLDWYGWSYVALNPRISYYTGSASHFEDRSFVQIGIPGLYEDTYDFRLLLLEPGLKISIPFKNVEVFWNGGSTIGFGSVKLEEQITPIRYENGEAIPRNEDMYIENDKENRRDIGFYFSTGISIPISSSFRLQAEIGYRSLNLEEFDNPANAKLNSLHYQLDSFTPSLGITYILR
jgi:hypothetical protein